MFFVFFSDLPAIPENIQIRQQKNNFVLLTWHNSKGQHVNESTSGNKDIRYLVEERHLLGPRYLESRLSPWTIRHISTKSHATIRERLKTGHWYQFRVAAINANGSRGYSESSRPFKTKGKLSLQNFFFFFSTNFFNSIYLHWKEIRIKLQIFTHSH